MRTKYTSGPWQAEEKENEILIGNESDGLIAIVELHNQKPFGIMKERANANLIAAAPNLLKELINASMVIEAVIEHFELHPGRQSKDKPWDDSMSDDLKTELNGIKIAIAKATGNNP